MPLGFQRLNERTHRPNENINFIKPLATSSEQDQKIAKDILERIAAQCYPIMKKEYISVMSLEEYPPNPEFLGRNFNAGEIIQLVLKDKAGRWLSFKFVQMVMMHELAHCKQMNHSRFFWKVRNQFAEAMQGLWAQNYTGEGVWGRGQDLESGAYVHGHMPDNSDIPEHLCGGTYRRRGKKRKRGQEGKEQGKMTYAERQQRRIAKKFGRHGEGHGLGENELVRGALEQGKRHYGKPRVANSKRGRELRANAALARFEAAKQQTKTPEPAEDDDSETESESDDEYGDSLPILEKLGEVTDQDGHHYFKIDEHGEDEGDGAQDELNELQSLTSGVPANSTGTKDRPAVRNGGPANLSKQADDDSEPEDGFNGNLPPKTPAAATGEKSELALPNGGEQKGRKDSEDDSETDDDLDARPPPQQKHRPVEAGIENLDSKSNNKPVEASSDAQKGDDWSFAAINNDPTNGNHQAARTGRDLTICPVCTLENDPSSPTCMACANVLKPKLLSNHWRCKSEACKGNKYINAADAGRCGLCGSLKPVVDPQPMGVTGGDVLRWD